MARLFLLLVFVLATTVYSRKHPLVDREAGRRPLNDREAYKHPIVDRGNSVCAQSCSDNFSNPGKDCTSLAAQGTGPCYTCGPLKTSPSELLCASICTDTSTSSSNCGACSNVCPSGSTCSSRSCKCTNSGLALCNGLCPDLTSDPNNCGTCDNVCPSGSTCSSGSCKCTNSGLALCNGQCPDLTSDPNNCGACGTVCPSGSCQNSACTCTPPESLTYPNAVFYPTYDLIFTGSGVTEDPNNPGNLDANVGYPPIIAYYPATYDACQAIEACATQAASVQLNSQYTSFDLHFFIDTQQWECVQYLFPQTCTQYFDIQNPNVGQTFGYSIPTQPGSCN